MKLTIAKYKLLIEKYFDDSKAVSEEAENELLKYIEFYYQSMVSINHKYLNQSSILQGGYNGKTGYFEIDSISNVGISIRYHDDEDYRGSNVSDFIPHHDIIKFNPDKYKEEVKAKYVKTLELEIALAKKRIKDLQFKIKKFKEERR